MLPMGMRRVPWPSTASVMRGQCDRLSAITKDLSAEQWRERVLIPPARGLEDDSRFWSLAMVADHLRRVNTRVTECLESLSAGRPVPQGPTQIVDFKPDPGSDSSAFNAYRTQLDEVERFFVRTASPPAQGTFPHPWFGPLTARQWAAFLPIHQSLHLVQAVDIRAGLA